MEGTVLLHKVPGNFHISSHDIPNVVVNLVRDAYKIDLSHKINHLSFGEKQDQALIRKRYSGQIDNELNGKDKTQQIPFGQWMVNYYLDISEAEYTDTTYTVSEMDPETGEVEEKNPVFIGFPYRSMSQEMITNMLPIVVFNMQITPIKVNYTMFYQTWPDFLVHMCAIVGGIFAAASIFESMLQNMTRSSQSRERQVAEQVEMKKQTRSQ